MSILSDLLARLAGQGRSDDFERPVVDLGPDRTKPTPYPVLRWSAANAVREGERVAARIAAVAPPSLLRVLREVGPLRLHESVIESAIGTLWPHVPFDQIDIIASLDTIVEGDVLWVGEARARGVAVRTRWDDPQLIGCEDLSDREPAWLLFVPFVNEPPHLMPLASSYEEALIAHLTGVALALTLEADRFDAAVGGLGGVDADLEPFVTHALNAVDRTAAGFIERADVEIRCVEGEYTTALDAGAARVRSRVSRMRAALARN